MSIRILERVTAFITRWQNDALELLVLHHPQVGEHLPSGTVDFDESLEDAVIREVLDETGLVDIEIVGRLGMRESILIGNERVILLTTKLFSTPTHDSSSGGHILKRGLPVHVSNNNGEFAAIRCDPLELHTRPPVRRSDISGYVRSSVLGKQVRNHMFKLMSTNQTADTWQSKVDGATFKFNWVKLNPRPRLRPPYAQLLDLAYERLVLVDTTGESLIDWSDKTPRNHEP